MSHVDQKQLINRKLNITIVCILDYIIYPSKSVKILSVILDSQMNIQQYIADTHQSSYMYVSKIHSTIMSVCKKSATSLVSGTVLTRLDYCNSVYMDLKLQLPQSTAARQVSKTHKHHHITLIVNRRRRNQQITI